MAHEIKWVYEDGPEPGQETTTALRDDGSVVIYTTDRDSGCCLGSSEVEIGSHMDPFHKKED